MIHNMRPLEPDLDMANAFLEALNPGGVFTFQTFCDRKDRPDRRLNRVFQGTLAQHCITLAKLNNSDAGVFVMVNEGDGVVHPGCRTCRTNANVVRVRSLFIDLDGAPLDPVLALPEQPSMVVESSSGRWHAYWHEVPCPTNDFAAAQVSLAKQFNSDLSVKDLARVMRLPGFWHQKGDPFQTRIVTLGKVQR